MTAEATRWLGDLAGQLLDQALLLGMADFKRGQAVG